MSGGCKRNENFKFDYLEIIKGRKGKCYNLPTPDHKKWNNWSNSSICGKFPYTDLLASELLWRKQGKEDISGRIIRVFME